ncbi:conserved hypothetical protein [Treponema primitia ZAS-2]|uniref:Uncharacterized protein n=1 Tax=Treponema primitia (strain ATCC BAA-887 / DSM 12427 / ZAS-2) TaxID=545694 RepID=F5YGT8_TREPZ|nr:hypothetical protein [Treponema primitia]AEF85958.1 conserved hypothetical protein [Treponema primitia ZAS-2]
MFNDTAFSDKSAAALLRGELHCNLRLVPPVLRARDFHLYTQDGSRLLDLWQYGGKAILGHTPPGVLRSFKNSAERGLFAPLPHPQERRFIKALSILLPGMDFRLYNSDTELRNDLNAAGFPTDAPLLWRPFLDEALPADRPLIPVLPLPWPGAPLVLALPTALLATLPEFPALLATQLPAQLLSPAILAAATRGIHDLIAASPARGRVKYPRIEQALTASPWQQRGIYLYYRERLEDEEWSGLFRQFLEQGFLLPPSQDQPLILPGILSAGEETKLAGLLR